MPKPPDGTDELCMDQDPKSLGLFDVPTNTLWNSADLCGILLIGIEF